MPFAELLDRLDHQPVPQAFAGKAQSTDLLREITLWAARSRTPPDRAYAYSATRIPQEWSASTFCELLTNLLCS
jgi:hypothetical protein